MPPPAPYLFPIGARFGLDNLVLHATARRHSVENLAGPLSVKSVRRGCVSWIVEGRPLVVDSSSFLLLGAGVRYSLNIDSVKPVETCCAFFAPGFVEEIASDLTSPLAHALDHNAPASRPLPYLSALRSDREHAVTRSLHSLAARCENRLNPSAAEEEFLLLAIALLGFYQQIQTESARVPALRSSTRQELFRRLLLGRDFIHAHASGLISLAAVARAACLSPFHFHRGFTRTFGQTPHTYLTELRLAQAHHSISRGASILDACVAAGWASPSAFSRLFRQRFGYPPSTLQRQFARSGKTALLRTPKLRA